MDLRWSKRCEREWRALARIEASGSITMAETARLELLSHIRRRINHQAYEAMMEKKLRNDRRKAIAFDLLMAGDHVSRKKAAEALTIARRLV